MELDASTSTTEGQHIWKSLSSTNSSVTLYRYVYNGSSTLNENVSKVSKDTYWLASRFISGSSSISYFARTRGIYGDGYYQLYESRGITGKNSAGVRPVVYLQPDIYLSYDATNGYGIN